MCLKGGDATLCELFEALACQTHRSWHLRVVVHSKSDPAWDIARKAIAAVGPSASWQSATVEPLADDPLEPNRNYIFVDFVVDVDFETVPRVLDVTFDPFFDDIDNRDGLLLIGNDVQAGVVDNAEEVFVRFTPDSRTQTVSLDDTSWTKNLTASIKLGVDHIKTGPDHILFIFVLLLPSVLVFGAMRWQPAASFTSALWRILKIASMFTLAHTITFTLAGLDLLPLPPSKVIEAVIALSIAAAAVHNLTPVLINKEWAIAFGFGLFHGMGFASLVGGLETSRSVQLISLLGRNIGIEIGQAIVILVAFPALFLLRRTKVYMPLFKVASVGLVIVSLGWMYERVFEHDLGINDAIAPWLDVQKAAIPLVLITALAFAYQWFEGTKGRLLPVFTDEASAIESTWASGPCLCDQPSLSGSESSRKSNASSATSGLPTQPEWRSRTPGSPSCERQPVLRDAKMSA